MSALREAGLAPPESETGLSPDEANSVANENDDCGAVDRLQVLNHVVLAQKKGEFSMISESLHGHSLLFANT